MQVEYKVINVLLASDPEKLTALLNKQARRNWHLFSAPVYVDQNSIQLTFEREYVEGALAKEIEEDSKSGDNGKNGKRRNAFTCDFGKYVPEE